MRLQRVLASASFFLIASAPLARAESHYRYQIMLRTRQMTKLSQHLAKLNQSVILPEDVTFAVDIDPVNLA